MRTKKMIQSKLEKQIEDFAEDMLPRGQLFHFGAKWKSSLEYVFFYIKYALFFHNERADVPILTSWITQRCV